ncbi:unnamed protein product [Rotaria sp. Silwood1]|nr:unnamed protein product [Rotaria sp. Silwood1]CAF3370672.1 unnamed protein product [Rotaria sp. Silwood1]CAF4574182.1 unnamed protein product [Rotaria sp. Silwood1]
MGGQNSKETITKSTMGATASALALSTSMLRREHMAENYVVIWMDEHIDTTNKDYKHTLAEFRDVVNQVNIRTTRKQCIQWLNENNTETSFVISSGALG